VLQYFVSLDLFDNRLPAIRADIQGFLTLFAFDRDGVSLIPIGYGRFYWQHIVTVSPLLGSVSMDTD
jgi:hypothetical protein